MEFQEKNETKPRNKVKQQRESKRKSVIKIQSCCQCHQHNNIQNHDEQFYYDFVQQIKQQLKHLQMSHVNIQKNRPFGYLSKSYNSVVVHKKAQKKQSFQYFNEISKKSQRFPRIGSFEVYFQNFIIFSKLNSSYKIERTNQSEYPEEQSSQIIMMRTLAQLIVSVIKVIQQNFKNIPFMQKVEDVFRFLELQWKPVNFKFSIVDYLMNNTLNRDLRSTDKILDKFSELINGKQPFIRINQSLKNSSRMILPYTYYKNTEKQSRMKSIYADRDKKNKGLSSSKQSLSRNSVILTKLKQKLNQKNSLKDNQEQKNPPDNIRLNRMSRSNLLPLLEIEPKCKQQKENVKDLRSTEQFKGFIIKNKHFKRKSVPPLDQENMTNKNLNSPQKKYGFISKKQVIKQNLFQKQVLIQSEVRKKHAKRQEDNVGKILCLTTSQNKLNAAQSVGCFLKNETAPNVTNNIFRHSKKIQIPRALRKYESNNLVRNCFSQRKNRPLSSTLINKKVIPKNQFIRNSTSVSQEQKQQHKKNYTNPHQNNLSQNICHQSQKINKKDQTHLIKKQSRNKLKQSKLTQTCQIPNILEMNSSKSLGKIQKSNSNRFSKDFIKQNIKKASFTKRTNSFGLTASYQERMNKKLLLDSYKCRKNRSNSAINKSLVCQKTFSNRQNSFKDQKQHSCKKCDNRQSNFLKNHTKNNSVISEGQRSIRSGNQDNISLQNSQNLENNFQQNQNQQIQGNDFQNKKILKVRNTFLDGSYQEIMQVNEQNQRDSTKQDKQFLISKQEKVLCNDQTTTTQVQNFMNNFSCNLGQNQSISQNVQKQKSKIQQKLSQQQHQQSRNESNLGYASNIITYTLGSQDEHEKINSKLNNYLQTTSYYNHKLYLSLQAYIKHQPAYLTQQLIYKDIQKQSQHFAALLRDKDFSQLQKIARLDFSKELTYQEFVVKSLRQIYRLDEIKLFPLNTVNKFQQFFHPEEVRSLYWQQQSSLLPEVVYILTKMNRKIVSRLFQNVKSLNYLGYYGIWLYNLTSNRFQLVVLNDEFCLSTQNNLTSTTDQKEFIFSGPLSQNSIWYMFLQKALAKILGGYSKINCCSFGQVFKMLTGCQYVQFKNINPDKLCKVLNQKILTNKKTYVYATNLKKCTNTDKPNMQNYCSKVERITGWNFNQKNPFLSLIHFQSSSNRIQSITMVDFIKQFDAITMIFFNPNFVFNQMQVQMKNGKKERKEVVQIYNSSFNKNNTCYISVTQARKQEPEQKSWFGNSSFNENIKSLKTTLKIYRQVGGYDSELPGNSVLGAKQEQEYSDKIRNCSFRYNGQITKNGEFFFEVSLTGGRNLCFIQSQTDNLNFAFYSEQRVDVKKFDQNQISKLKLLNGKQFLKEQQNNRSNDDLKNSKQNFKKARIDKSQRKDRQTLNELDQNKFQLKHKNSKINSKRQKETISQSRSVLKRKGNTMNNQRKFLQDSEPGLNDQTTNKSQMKGRIHRKRKNLFN